MWSQFKKKFKEMNGCDRVHLQSYIYEFMWRQCYTGGRIDSYDQILKELGTYYPPDSKKLVSFDDDNDEGVSFVDLNEDENDGTWNDEENKSDDDEENKSDDYELTILDFKKLEI
jgi:hypothetical protein